MLIITKNLKNKQYKIPETPNFQYRTSEIYWLKKQKKLASLFNIKSVSIQIKDIKQMIYSDNSRLISFYTKSCRNNYYNLNDFDYITIYKTNELKKDLIYSLINTDWLINVDDIKHKSFEEIEEDCNVLENKINLLKEKINHNSPIYHNINNRIKLLQYKLSCLNEFLLTKKTEDKTITQNNFKEVSKCLYKNI